MSYTRDPRDYKYGTTSENVRELQEKLIDAGHDIKADGVFGEKTRKAILTFEQDLTLSNSTSFCVDRVTMEYLFNGGVLTPPKPPEPSIGVPKGKGMFVRSWKHCESPEALRERVRSAGLGWVCILRLWQHEDEDDNLATANFVARLTGRTDPSGKLNETGGCGPYLKGFPANVFAETAAAQVIQFDGTPDRQSGWYYHTTSNTIYANVGEEHLPFNYGGADLVGTDIKTLIATP